ncbi:MAG: S8 family peptidase, partial [Calditrichia bacterium]
MLRSLSLFLILCFSFPVTVVGQQIIVRLSPSVLISEKAPGISKYISNSPELNSILARRPPGRIRKLFRNSKRKLPAKLSNIYIWQYEGEDTAQQVTSELRGIPAVVYAQKNRAFKISLSPNDADYAQQWYLPAIHAERAWDIEQGNPSVIVGVIDTGIDYNHEDLQRQLWVNSPEDINQNGRLDSLDVNGIDDDGNGYIDDVIGWDFTDAPNFPDRGDFRDPDNDPMDEFSTGHGTPIAGIISAAQNNRIGISGLAPGARIMALRAGTASGFLEEDDVAEAIIYAIDNGCRIVNMSFGDFTISYLLRDAIRYGESEGLIFVAASGNSGNTVLQYPAALDETIAVGATTRTDSLASFSTGGSKLNLVAPGQEIYSCQIGNSYGFNNGTSFSAPVVSGALALIWSFHPNFSPQEIKGALYAGCTDLGRAGWDISYGHGLVNVFRSLQIIDQGFAEISHPGMNDGFAVDQLAITGTVFSPALYSFSLSYGTGETPREWFQIAEVTGQQVIEDTLAEWDISALPDTTYTIELVLRQNGLQDIISRTIISIDHTPPFLDSLKTTGMFEGPDDGFLIEFL